MKNRSRAKLTPSLLEPEARGGDTAEGGFSFQENVVLARIPVWLAQGGFTSMIREAMGDVEAKFFLPGRGFVMEFVEAKNHVLSATEFWGEIKRFRQMEASRGHYRWFTLVAEGLPKKLMPLVHGLRRIRDPYGFYEDGSAVKDNSFKEYVQIIRRLNHTERDARFLFEKVRLEVDQTAAQSHGEVMFTHALIKSIPEYQDLPAKTLGDIYRDIGTFVRNRKNQPIIRKELEAFMLKSPASAQSPVLIHTAIQAESDNTPGLRFEWAEFFGGEARAFPPPEVWNGKLLGELRETRDWIVQHRSTRRIRLTGNRRLSASLAIGSIFSAVAGFSIEMESRGGAWWATDAYPPLSAPSSPLISEFARNGGERLIVSMGVLKDIRSEVEAYRQNQGLANMPTLHLRGEQPIVSPEQANVTVGAIKSAILEALSRSGSKQIDLFFAGPAQVALFLGHRLNATASVQCYEWVSTDVYTPTCQLP